MSAYLQMGDNTENLVGAKDLDEFRGIVLSPVNRKDEEMVIDIVRFRNKKDYDIIFDPQMYVPRSSRKNLHTHRYFPDDLETADLDSDSWWKGITAKLAQEGDSIGVNAIASPATLPNIWNDDYFVRCAETSRALSEELGGTNIRTLTTILISFAHMGAPNEALKLASIISEAEPSGYYLVVYSEVPPRRELQGENELSGIMTLINELEKTGKPVLISHCSSDMLLFKAAGASSCATGKFFNLRRFTKSRYGDKPGGGGQLSYWFEHSLVTFLEEADVKRLRDENYGHLLGTLHSNNHWSNEILEDFKQEEKVKWTAKGWKQYLSWFGKTEEDLSANNASSLVREWLITAESNWRVLHKNDILFDDPDNDGKWIRNWRQALSKFRRSLDNKNL